MVFVEIEALFLSISLYFEGHILFRTLISKINVLLSPDLFENKNIIV